MNAALPLVFARLLDFDAFVLETATTRPVALQAIYWALI
jgi:hypothetical protein